MPRQTSREIAETRQHWKDMLALRDSPQRQRLAPIRRLVLAALRRDEQVPAQFPDTGAWSDCRYCYLEPDWILIYRIEASRVILIREGVEKALFN
ncbi:MAG TPA: type II toxin-antitoxin system mRNA interferase toxin, RelE/StbE family [Gammaproteobacteria bacterium]